MFFSEERIQETQLRMPKCQSCKMISDAMEKSWIVSNRFFIFFFFTATRYITKQRCKDIHCVTDGWFVSLIFGDRYLENLGENNADCKRQGRNYVWTTGKPFRSELQDLASTRGRLAPALTCTCVRAIQIQCFVIYTFTVHACVLALPRLPNKTRNTHVLDSFKPRER